MQNNLHLSGYILFIALLLGFAGQAGAQESKEAKKPADVIIKADGSILYGKVIELNADNIRYLRAEMPDGPIVAIPRKDIYAISYTNQTYEILTPVLAKSKSKSTKSETPVVVSEPAEKEEIEPDSLSNSWEQNIAKGNIKMGMGFSRSYSSIKGIDDYTKTPSAPSLCADYNFKYNKYIKLGATLGVAGFKYAYDNFSEYDQIGIKQDITEKVATIGVYARYDLTRGIFTTYVRGGVDFNFTMVDANGEIYFKDDNKKVTTHSEGRGVNSDFVFRGGAEIYIGKNFGLYSDFGTGKSLVQVGVVFCLAKK